MEEISGKSFIYNHSDTVRQELNEGAALCLQQERLPNGKAHTMVAVHQNVLFPNYKTTTNNLCLWQISQNYFIFKS